MKKQGMFLFLGLLIFLMFLPVQGLTKEKVDFKTYDKGIKLVKSANKKAFVFFYADWCKYCKKMKDEALSNEQVIEYLNENFVPIIVDTDTEGKIASKYNAKKLPMLYFLKEDASVLTYRPGYVETKELLYMLKFVNTESYQKMSFTDFVNQN
ncbi:MAG: thioredoxin fold domain-containing protein [Desulfobacteraceae bacterium]|nr:thioredoxin fold domain-containing protein [Desulfobacteraceae bacterium]